MSRGRQKREIVRMCSTHSSKPQALQRTDRRTDRQAGRQTDRQRHRERQSEGETQGGPDLVAGEAAEVHAADRRLGVFVALALLQEDQHVLLETLELLEKERSRQARRASRGGSKGASGKERDRSQRWNNEGQKNDQEGIHMYEVGCRHFGFSQPFSIATHAQRNAMHTHLQGKPICSEAQHITHACAYTPCEFGP